MPSKTGDEYPILYSFRRCPYAIRARLALAKTKINVVVREVDLKNKPHALLSASPKGTVPVLVLKNNTVIDESLDIMIWASTNKDVDGGDILTEDQLLIKGNDDEFKYFLDRYKYFEKYPEHPQSYYQRMCFPFLMKLESRLLNQAYLSGHDYDFLDFVFFPFVRQFAKVDEEWFKQSHLHFLKKWLREMEESTIFKSIMKKYAPWQEGDKPQYLLSDLE